MFKELCAVAVIGAMSSIAHAGVSFTWDGGGSSANWSDPLNWSSNTVPPAGSALTFGPAPVTLSNQNLANPFSVSGITFTASHTISGSAITSTGDITVQNNAVFGNTISAPISFPNGATITTPVNPSFGRALDLTNVGGAGNLTINGAVLFFGSTSFAGPVNTVGRLAVVGAVQAQSSYTVTGDFFGDATMSFPVGSKLDVNGRLAPGEAALPSDFGALNIGGDVKLRGALEIELLVVGSTITADRLDVSGIFDAQGTLNLLGSSVPAGQYLIGSYGSRVGTLTPQNGSYSILYTSADNAGPGQIFVVVPEPSALAFASVALAMTCARRRRSHPKCGQ